MKAGAPIPSGRREPARRRHQHGHQGRREHDGRARVPAPQVARDRLRDRVAEGRQHGEQRGRVERGRARSQHDEHADEADHHRRPASPVDRLAEHERRERGDEQRRREGHRRDRGQRQRGDGHVVGREGHEAQEPPHPVEPRLLDREGGPESRSRQRSHAKSPSATRLRTNTIWRTAYSPLRPLIRTSCTGNTEAPTRMKAIPWSGRSIRASRRRERRHGSRREPNVRQVIRAIVTNVAPSPEEVSIAAPVSYRARILRARLTVAGPDRVARRRRDGRARRPRRSFDSPVSRRRQRARISAGRSDGRNRRAAGSWSRSTHSAAIATASRRWK